MRIRIVISLWAAAALLSCNKQELIPDRDVVVLGSGGMGIASLYPMNSYESILQCLYLGADGTEIDVQMTSDSVLVAYHDEDLSASTQLEGAINSHTWAELAEASYDAAPYTGYGLVRLDTLFRKLVHPEQYIFSFDCKLFAAPGRYDAFIKSYTAQIIKLLDDFHMTGNVLIESTDSAFLRYFKNLKETYSFYINHPSFETAVAVADNLDLSGIIMDAEAITAEEIAEAQSKGLSVQVWGTDNRSQNIAAARKRPDYIQANDVRSLVDLLQ